MRLDYNSSSAVTTSTILTASPWTSSGLTVTVTSNTDVKFEFANESVPPTSVISYFWSGNADVYNVNVWGTGNQTYAIKSTALSSTFVSSEAFNNFFTSFGSFELQFDVSPGNFGGAKRVLGNINTHAYLVFGF